MTTKNPDEPEVIETPVPAEVEVEETDEELEPEESDEPSPEETPEQLRARIANLTERNGKLYARIKRSKGKPAAPAAPAPAAPAPAAPAATPALSRDEGILFAKGFTEAEVEQAKKVATLQGVKLTDAVADPLFIGWKAIEDKKVKDAAAQLPPSRGGRPSKPQKGFGTKDLSDEEHKELFQEKLGK